MLFGAITLAFNPFRRSRQLWLSDSRTFHMQVIAKHFGVSRMTASRAVRRHEGDPGNLALPL